MIYSYPQFPSYNNSLTTYIISILEWIVEIPLIAGANFFGGISNSITTSAQTSSSSIIGFIGTTWDNSITSFRSLGIFAPVVASIIWGGSIVILIFFIAKALQLGIRETEED